MRVVQKFSSEYLALCGKMTPDQIVKFLEGFRKLHADRNTMETARSKLISMKVDKRLLDVFKKQCRFLGTPYQTQIKRLMTDWLTRKTSEPSAKGDP